MPLEAREGVEEPRDSGGARGGEERRGGADEGVDEGGVGLVEELELGERGGEPFEVPSLEAPGGEELPLCGGGWLWVWGKGRGRGVISMRGVGRDVYKSTSSIGVMSMWGVGMNVWMYVYITSPIHAPRST